MAHVWDNDGLGVGATVRLDIVSSTQRTSEDPHSIGKSTEVQRYPQVLESTELNTTAR